MSDLVGKWGEAVAARGFTQVPNYLLLLNQFLPDEIKLPPSEMMVLLTLVGAWWKKGTLPFPSVKSIATRANISERQALRALSSLEKKGFLKREKSTKAGGVIARNVYDLTPLTAKLEEVAAAFPNIFPRKIK
jgi:DNA-binding MarR family transcriptional regulator